MLKFQIDKFSFVAHKFLWIYSSSVAPIVPSGTQIIQTLPSRQPFHIFSMEQTHKKSQSLLFSHITESQATKLQQWKPPSYFGLNSITKYVIREHQPPLTLMSLKPAFMCVCLLVCVLFYTVLNEYELIVDTLHFCFLIPKKPTSCDTHPLVFCCFTLMRSIIALCICNTCKCDKSVFHVRSSFCVSYSKGWK